MARKTPKKKDKPVSAKKRKLHTTNEDKTTMRKRSSTNDLRGVHPYLRPGFVWPDLKSDGKTLPLMEDFDKFCERRKRWQTK